MKIKKAAISMAVLIITSIMLSIPVYADTAEKSNVMQEPAIDEETAKNETVYAMLKGDGSVDNIYVVNQLIGEYVDYGVYSEIKNMSTSSVPRIDGDKITFSDAYVAGGLFYQGTMDAPLPMVFDITYTLDGINITADELAGRNGHLRINIAYDINALCDEAVRDGYMAQITMAMRTDTAKNVNATDFTQVLAGSTLQLGYAVLPGESGLAVVEADVSDFEMDAISITLMKGMPSLGDFEESIDEVENGFGEMLDGAGDMIDGTTELKDGMTSLKNGMGDLSYGLGQLSDAGDTMMEGMSDMSDGIAAYTSGINDAAAGAAQMKTALDSLAQNGQSVADGVAAIDDGLAGLCASSADLKALAQSLIANPDPSVQALAQGVLETLGAADTLSLGLSQASLGVSDYTAGAAQIAGEFGVLSDGLAVSGAAGAQLSEGFAALSSGYGEFNAGIGSSANGAYRLYSGIKQLPGSVQELIDGQIAFQDGIAEAQDEITSQTESLTGDTLPPVSFASPTKNKPDSVQYILTTPPIRKEEVIEEVQSEETRETFLTRFADLFK